MLKSSAAQAILSRTFLVVMALTTAIVLAGCGGSGMNTPQGSTNVMVLMTGTANDKLVNFEVQVTNITLTNAAGASVTLLSRTLGTFVSGFTEFMHLNGASEPLVIASVPQGTYTSATVTVATCQFTLFTKDSTTGGTLNATFQQGTCGNGTGKTTVNLSGPITITGQAMALSFNLQVSQSYTVDLVSNNFTVTPVFTLAPITVSAQPTNDQNGKVTGVDAVISSLNGPGNSLMVQTTSGFTLNVNTDANTQFQATTGLSALSAGMLVNLDVAMQSSGGLLATRVEMDQATANQAYTELPTQAAGPGATVIVAEPQDCFPPAGALDTCENLFVLDPSVSFHISGQFNNLGNLPFTPNFSSSAFFLGQSVFMFSSGVQVPGALDVTELTLVPQTINATVTSVSSIGNFNVYTVSVASYDLIPTTQQFFLGPFPAIGNPTSVTVYADANTQMLQSSPISAGSLLRFRGLIFYDNGTLRMDCVRILDGVPE